MQYSRIFILILAIAAFLGCSSGDNGDSGTNPPPNNNTAQRVEVAIVNFAFSPDDVTINVGDTIVWTNDDQSIHTTTSTGGTDSWDSGNLSNGTSFTKVFNNAGVTNYRCEIHPATMTGSVTVEE